MARPVLHADIPWIPFAPAILVAAWYGGIGPGLAAILLSVLATDYFLLEPHGALGLRTAGQATGVVVFALTGALMIALIERVRAAQAERERAGEVQRRLASMSRRRWRRWSTLRVSRWRSAGGVSCRLHQHSCPSLGDRGSR